MDYQTSKSRYILTSLAIIIVITAFILVGLNALIIQKGGTGLLISSTASQEELDASYKLGYQAARDKADSLCDGVKLSVNSFTGTVVANDGEKLVVAQNSLMADPLADGISDNRTVLVSANTKIVKSIKKSDEQFIRELKNFETAQATGNTNSESPNDTIEQVLKLSDIKVGSKVSVSSNEDVTLLATVSSTKILLQ